MSSTSSTVIKNIRWMVISKIIVYLLSIITITLIPRYLGVEGYGQLNFILSFVGLFIIFGDFGISSLIYRDVSKNPKNASEYFNGLFLLKIFLLVLMILVIVIATIFINKSLYIKELILFLGIPYILISVISSFYLYFYNALQKMQFTAIYDMGSKFLYIIFVICAIYFNFKLIGILIANVISLVLICFFLILFFRKYIKIKLNFNFKYIISKLKATGFFAGISFFTLVYYNADKLLVSFFIGDYQLGLYVIGYTFFGLLISFIYIFNSALFPVLSKYSTNLNKFKQISEKFIKYLFIISTPILFGGVYLANKIISLAFGDKFIGGLIAFQIILFFFFIVALNTYNLSTLQIKNKERVYFFLVMVAAIFNIVVDLFIIPIYGIVGAAVVTVLSELIVFIGSYLYVKKHIKLSYWKQSIHPFIGSVLMIISLYLIDKFLYPNGWFHNKFDVLIFVLIGSIIYGLFLIITKTITIKEIKAILSRKI